MSATFAAQSGEAGQVCKVTANGTVEPCEAEESFCGVLEGIRGGFAGVQLHGFAMLSYTGTAPSLGYCNLVADGSGGIKTGEAGKSYLVVNVDEDAMTATIEL